MGVLRQSRTARPASGADIKLQERDHWILESLGKMACLATGQLAALHFEGSAWAAQKRLVRLHRAGYIRAWVPDGNLATPNVYTLDRRGRELLATTTGERWTAPHGLDGQLKHRLLINEVRIRLALALEESEGELVFWRTDRELAGRFREPVVPDGLFSIRWPEGEYQYAVEVERETRAPQRFLRKVLRYRAFSNLYGLGPLGVLVVAQNERWLARYREALQRAFIDVPVLFAMAEAATKQPLEPVWVGLATDDAMSLRDLPCRNDGQERRSG
jgi:hypothetical protein